MKIPKQAKKVFSGEIFDIYQWPQKLYDGSVATYEIIKRQYASRIIATQNNKIVLGQEWKQGRGVKLGIFGGRIENGETPLKCAKRELLEEAGLESNDWELLYVDEVYPDKMDFLIYIYVARNCKKIAKQKLDPGEKIKTKIVSFDEYVKIALKGDSPLVKKLKMNVLQMKAERKLNQFKKKLFKTKKT